MSLNLKSRIFILFGKHHAAGIAYFDVSPQLRFMQFSSPVQLTNSSMENLRFVKQLGLKDNCGLSPDLHYTSGSSGLVSVCLSIETFLADSRSTSLTIDFTTCFILSGDFSSSDSLPPAKRTSRLKKGHQHSKLS
jgi:hypothetical protein